jgi:phage repressor protein C with HTH and peptisase S24 domain
MDLEAAKRLRLAREAAKYDTATAAAEAMGVKVPTYVHHENGNSGLSRAGAKYARFYRISLEWLLTGKGEMRPSREKRFIPIKGYVGGGAIVDIFEEPGERQVEIPAEGDIEAFVVKGDSMRPRFLPGEIVLYDPDPAHSPAELVGQYAVVQTADGQTLIKILRKGSREDRYRLESFNADPIEDVEVSFARRYLGVLPPAKPEPIAATTRPKAKRKR